MNIIKKMLFLLFVITSTISLYASNFALDTGFTKEQKAQLKKLKVTFPHLFPQNNSFKQTQIPTTSITQADIFSDKSSNFDSGYTTPQSISRNNSPKTTFEYDTYGWLTQDARECVKPTLQQKKSPYTKKTFDKLNRNKLLGLSQITPAAAATNNKIADLQKELTFTQEQLAKLTTSKAHLKEQRNNLIKTSCTLSLFTIALLHNK